jgi:hypothetical protein
VRRWDGQAWTDEVRPLPDWLRTVRLSAGPGSSRHRLPLGAPRLWLVTAALLSLGAALMVLLATGAAKDPDRVHDRAFVRGAGRRCEQAAADVRTVRASASMGGISSQARADRADAEAAVWADVVDDLAQLPVAGVEDHRRVDRWLATWDRWVTLGHDYADAIEAGDDVEARAVVDAGERERAALVRFAIVNKIGTCAP